MRAARVPQPHRRQTIAMPANFIARKGPKREKKNMIASGNWNCPPIDCSQRQRSRRIKRTKAEIVVLIISVTCSRRIRGAFATEQRGGRRVQPSLGSRGRPVLEIAAMLLISKDQHQQTRHAPQGRRFDAPLPMVGTFRSGKTGRK